MVDVTHATIAGLDKFWTDTFIPKEGELEQKIKDIVTRFKDCKTPSERTLALPWNESILEKVLDKLREEYGSIPEIDMTKLNYQQRTAINLYRGKYQNAFQAPKSD